MQALHHVNPKQIALINERYKEAIGEESIQSIDSTCMVTLTHYDANALTYEVNSSNGGVVVFSEVYYPDWQATVDGEPVDIACADYILRAIKVPGGKHTVEFRFDPQSLHTTEVIANVALVLMMLTFLFLAGREIKRRHKNK
jgi:uncharacterized membrane protein YfhO